jgi:thiol-disulfide isomerase/thioredoxin
LDGNSDGLPVGAGVSNLVELLAVDKPLKNPGKPILVVFVAPGCPGCDDIIPALKESQLDSASGYNLVFVSMLPGTASQFEFIRQSGIDAPIVLRHGWTVATRCQVQSAPYAMLFDSSGTLLGKCPAATAASISTLVDKNTSSPSDEIAAVAELGRLVEVPR